MEQTSLEELKRTAASGAYRRIPIWREIFSDIATPVQVLKKLLAVSDHCFLLESAEDNKQWGRYSFLGFDPAMELTCMNHQVTITTDHVEQFETENPAQVIARVIEENRAPQIKKLPPLTGGLVGYFAYDYIKYAEPTLRLDAEDQEKFRDVDLMLFDKMIAFDHYRQKIILICNSRISEADVQAEGGQTAGAAAATDLRARGKSARAAADAPVSAAEPDTLEAVYRTAIQTLDQMQDIIEKGAEKNVSAGRLTTELTPLFDQESYCEKVEQVKHYIHEGDIFQLVLSNRLEAGFDGSLLDTYRILRTKNPSPYMFYFSSDDLEIAGASPETLVKVDNQTAYTFPLAGTRPRGKDEKEDQELEADLLSDEKELEHLGVQPLVMKGIVCRSLYPKPDLRPSGDEDLLISAKDFATVDACFMRKGFVRDKETAMPNGAKDGDAPEEMGYIHPKTGVFYEIHTRLFSTESSAYGYLNRAFSDVFAHPSKVEVQGQSIFTLEETHHLFYLLCHSFKHFLHGGVGIRQICDMVQMIRVYGRKIDWEMFWQLCEEYHMTCFCINLLDIGERYLGFSYEASGAVRAAKKLHPDSEALLIDILDAGSFGKSSAGRIHSANITLYAAETGAEKHTAGGIWKSLVPEASYIKNKYPYAARYPFLLPAAYVQRILKWLGQGEKEQKSSIEVGAGRVELLKKYDMIRTADWKKRGDAHAGRIQREK